MIESAAQLSSFFVKQIYGLQGFIGFASIDEANSVQLLNLVQDFIYSLISQNSRAENIHV